MEGACVARPVQSKEEKQGTGLALATKKSASTGDRKWVVTPSQQHTHYVPAQVYPSASLAANTGPSVNNCSAIGCTRKVHYDRELGPFDYCSPECRNRDLLPRERERLTKEIEAIRASMATTVISTFTPEPSSPSRSRASNSASYIPPSSSKDDSHSSASSASTFSGKVVAAGTTIDGKKSKLTRCF